MPRQNTPLATAVDLCNGVVAASKCGWKVYRHPAKIEPLTASLFESHTAKVGPSLAFSSVLHALKRAA